MELSVTVGQYTFAAFDSNLYAGNALTNFISYPLTQNGTQAYPNGGLGAYAQATTRDQQFTFAGGFQGATNVTGDALSTRGFSTGKYAYFMAGEWAPNFLGGEAYSLLGYSQPSVPQEPSNRPGISFNAVQDFDPKWGLFLRANGASGTATPIETSVAWGGIYNNPFERNKLDQVGLGLLGLANQLDLIRRGLLDLVDLLVFVSHGSALRSSPRPEPSCRRAPRSGPGSACRRRSQSRVIATPGDPV